MSRGGDPPVCRRPLVAAGILAVGGMAHLAARSAGPAQGGAGDRARGDGEAEGERIDWEALRRENPEVVAWLRVGGTGIDLPVVQPGGGKSRVFYLDHGFGMEPDPRGTPYLDIRCTADGMHRLVFGHHVIGEPSAQFSPVHRAFEQQVFDGITGARWETPNGVEILEPLCALRVSESFEPIQRFSFADDGLRPWIAGIARQADTRSESAGGIVEAAGRCLTLATCSNPVSGQDERTLLLFAG